jgi:putative transposase
MNLTLMVKLQPTPDQSSALLETMERFNAACNAVAEVAFRERTANKIRLQKLVYYDIRERFGLPAQMAVRVIGKVAEAYKRDRSRKPSFRAHGAIVYDQRVLSWKGLDRVSILTLRGRQIVPVVFGGYQAARLKCIRGQADLIYRNGTFYLAVVVDVPEPPAGEPKDWLGVDLGIVNIAADSDGEAYSGGHLNGLRRRHARLRARLQAKGTRSARRLLKKRSGKERRFATNVNHVISKRLVAKAKGTGRGIALEDLKGIRCRITVKKAQRRVQHSWAFHQLRSFIEYKARLAGVPVVLVGPRNTSRTCPACGHVAKANRRTQALFCCVSCGFAGPADTIAAENIRRAVVMRPYAASAVGG